MEPDADVVLDPLEDELSFFELSLSFFAHPNKNDKKTKNNINNLVIASFVVKNIIIEI